MPKLQVNQLHPTATEVHGYKYIFTEKHHGGPSAKRQANWLPELSLDEEFSIFNEADRGNYADDDGKLYGLLKTPTTRCRTLGTCDEQVAVFPPPNEGSPWHGYPVYPLAGHGEKSRPKAEVFARMVETQLLTHAEARRLKGGRTI